jgi:transposase
MDTHKNAPLTPKGRELMVRVVVDDGLTKAAAARQFRTSPKTVGKWVKRFDEEGVEGCTTAPHAPFPRQAKLHLPHAPP